MPKIGSADFINKWGQTEPINYWIVSPTATRLLVCLASQFNAGNYNNGDLCAAQSEMAKYGWKDSTRKRALKALEDIELIVKTRQGHKRRCSLYALSWLTIDICPGKPIGNRSEEQALQEL